MAISKDFFNWLGALKDSALGKTVVGLLLTAIGLILLLLNPDDLIVDPILEFIDSFDLIWIIIFFVGLLILVVGIYELLKEADLIK